MYKYVTDIKPFGEFITELAISSQIVLDIETTGLDCFTDDILLLQVKTANQIFIFDIRKLGDHLTYLMQLIDDSNILVIGHAIKFDLKFLKVKTGILLRNVYDTMLAEIFNYQGISSKKFISLEDLVPRYLPVQLNKAVRDTFIDFSGEITQQQLIYSAEDVAHLEKIKEVQMKRSAEISMLKVINLEMKLIPVVVSMELNGIKLDTEKWLLLKEKAEIEAKKLKEEIYSSILEELKNKDFVTSTLDNPELVSPILDIFDSLSIKVQLKRNRKLFENKRIWNDFISLFNEWFNINSPKQVFNILSNVFEIKKLESTNSKDLVKISKKYPIVDIIIKYREINKAITSFGDNYINQINPITGRIHPTLHQQIADSGRFSCENPNMQNIKRDKEYRNAFIAEDGYVLIDCDFSQQEYRLAGSITREPVIIEAYKNGIDMHTVTASNVFGIDPDKITKEQRDKAKSYNFAILYGANKYGLSYALDCSKEEAEKIIKSFYDGYPVLAKVKKALESKILGKLFSSTLLGRKRFFEQPQTIFSRPEDLAKWRRNIEKEGFNHIIQGTGADIMKEALVELFINNPFSDEDFKIILTVHDEVLCEVKKEIKEKAKEYIINTMERIEQKYLGEIPAKAEAVISNCWEH